jgi:hypothetical protein
MNRNKIMNMAPPTMVVTRSVQLGQRCIRVFAQPGLEEPGESERQRLARPGTGQLGEVAVPFAVRSGSREPGGEDDRGVPVGAGPAGGCLE